jgi:hypothetical protein
MRITIAAVGRGQKTAADETAAANTYLKKENRVVLYYLPKNQN